MSGEMADSEREELFELVNSSDANKVYFDEMQQIWDMSGVDEEKVDLDVDQAWQKVTKRIEPEVVEQKPAKEAKTFRLGQLLRVAAVLVGVLAAFWLYNRDGGDTPQDFMVYDTQVNETEEIRLPDGSKVWLNGNSTLRYKKNFHPRLVELEGEAFFDVKHLDKDHKFEIQSGATKTTVLGTSFNVRAYPEEDQVEVTVETGRVVLEKEKEKTQKATKQVVLDAGESGIYKKKEANVVKAKTTMTNANAWKTKQLKFNDTKISDVINTLERYYEINITTEDQSILNCSLNGTYTNPKLEEMMEYIKLSLSISISQDENNLTFSGEGCK